MGCGESKQKTDNKKDNLKIKDNDDNKKVSKEYEIKICLLGDVSVGKTSIASRFCKNSFNENYINTIGGAYQQQNIVLNNGAKIKLHICTPQGRSFTSQNIKFKYFQYIIKARTTDSKSVCHFVFVFTPTKIVCKQQISNVL